MDRIYFFGRKIPIIRLFPACYVTNNFLVKNISLYMGSNSKKNKLFGKQKEKLAFELELLQKKHKNLIF